MRFWEERRYLFTFASVVRTNHVMLIPKGFLFFLTRLFCPGSFLDLFLYFALHDSGMGLWACLKMDGISNMPFPISVVNEGKIGVSWESGVSLWFRVRFSRGSQIGAFEVLFRQTTS